MLIDEARIRNKELQADGRHIQQGAILDQAKRLEKLQATVCVVRARLGLPAIVRV